MTTPPPSSLWTQTLATIRDTTASSSPTPGGGSITVVGATLGLSLVLMALAITHKKTPDDPTLNQLLDTGHTLLDRLSPHADRDVALFTQFMDALALPRQTPAQRDTRQQARQQALHDATQGPLNAATDILQALQLAQQALPLASSHVRSDVLAGADLLYGSLHGVLRNVDINLPGLHNETLRTTWAARAQTLRTQAEEHYTAITSP
ncbi:MAG: cyclodeaminase/cyclohydrolase family protein [Myxococcota bacterium]